MSRLKLFARRNGRRLAAVAVLFSPGMAMASSGSTTVTWPSGFDVPGILTAVVGNNQNFILGGLGAVAGIFIFMMIARALRRGAGKVAGN